MIRIQLFGTPVKIVAGDRKIGWARVRHTDGQEQNLSILWSLSEDTEGEIDSALDNVPDYNDRPMLCGKGV